MKAIIYTGIGLISAAAVYGMADYYGSNRNGSLKALYHEHVIPETPVQPLYSGSVAQLSLMDEDEIAEAVPVSSTEKKIVKKKRPAPRFEDFSRTALVPEEEVITIVAPEPVIHQPELTASEIKEKEAEAVPAPVVVEEKKIDLRMFSRAKPVARKIKVSEQKKN